MIRCGDKVKIVTTAYPDLPQGTIIKVSGIIYKNGQPIYVCGGKELNRGEINVK